MICKSCRKAGRKLAKGKSERAVELHLECPAWIKRSPSHCDCQHAVEQSYINPEYANGT